MINPVPIKILGTILCVSALLVTQVFASDIYDHAKAKTDLSGINEKLQIIKSAATSPKKVPLYRKNLGILASWIIGDQYGEDSITKSLGIEAENESIVDQMKNVNEILKQHIIFLKKSAHIKKLEEISLEMKNGILLNEIFEKLAQKDYPKTDKMEKIGQIAEIIYKLIYENEKELLIPAVWKGSSPGGMLISMKRGYLRVFDTRYSYSSNKIKAGMKNPLNIESCRSFGFVAELDRFKAQSIVLALINMKDENVLYAYETKELNNFRWAINGLASYFFKLNGEPGKQYFEKVFLDNFGKMNDGSLVCKSVPLFRYGIGTLGDIQNFLHNVEWGTAHAMDLLKLEIGARLLKTFMNRFSSDSDIQFETRSKASITEIIKRCMNRLVNDAYNLSKDIGLINGDIGATETSFWEHLNDLDSSEITMRKNLKLLLEKQKNQRLTGTDIILNIERNILPKNYRLTAADNYFLNVYVSAYLSSLVKTDESKIKENFELIMQYLLNLKHEHLLQRFGNTLGSNEKISEKMNSLENNLNRYIADGTNADVIMCHLNDDFFTNYELNANDGQNLNNYVKELINRDFAVNEARRTLNEETRALKEQSDPLKEIYRQLKADPSSETLKAEKNNLELSLKPYRDSKKEALLNFTTSVKKRKQSVNKILGLLVNKMKKNVDSAFVIEKVVKVVKLRTEVYEWIATKGPDLNKFRKISRNLDQIETPLNRKTYISMFSKIEKPLDLLNFMPKESSAPDYTNCMAYSKTKITTIEEFIKAFDFLKVVWNWFSFKFELKSAHCESFIRRNAELLLQNMEIGGMDEASLKLWTPKTPKQYSKFKNAAQSILNSISTLNASGRTLEDYIILLRLQRIVWRVAQALDLSFSRKEPHRHLDLIKYSLSYPQCHQLLEGHMNYSNFFLADSGFYGNILNPASMEHLKSLCRELIDEENSLKPILDYQKYFKKSLTTLDAFSVEDFDNINEGDREIYYRMAQHPKIANIVRGNHENYNMGMESIVDNAARACSIGKVGAQFIYYQFFDAVRTIFTTTNGLRSPILSMNFIPITYVPFQKTAYLFILKTKKSDTTTIGPVNAELVKGIKKSYIKVLASEMLTSHILGLDVIVNHLGRASAKLWSSGSIPLETEEAFDYGSLQWLVSLVESFTEIIGFFSNADPNPKEHKIKTFRKTIAGNADFFINCSSHLIRKLDVAPEYETLVMSLLFKTILSVGNDLEDALKKMEKEKIDINGDEPPFDEPQAHGYGYFEDANAEQERNQNYLEKTRTSPNEFLKSLINWSVIAIRFTARVRAHKHEWRDRFSSAPTIIYDLMSKFSRLSAANAAKLAPFDKKLLAHVDYVLYMTIILNPNDANLKNHVFAFLQAKVSAHSHSHSHFSLEKKDDLMSAAIIFHRFLALSLYSKDKDGPITEDFISNQLGIAQVMASIASLAEHNESLLTLMAVHMSSFLSDKTPPEILETFSHGANLANGVLVYDAYAINLIQGTLTRNGFVPQDPNDIMKYGLFKRFFSAGGSDGSSASLGKPTIDCPNRYEVKDYLNPGSNYSLCENKTSKVIKIYRQIPRFKKPCILILDRKVINLIQEAFSVFTNEGVDLYHCVRGNNGHFVWIGRNSINPSYISYGRNGALESLFLNTYDNFINNPKFHNLKVLLKNYLKVYFDFEVKLNIEGQNDEDTWIGFIKRQLAPAISFPKLEIVGVSDGSLFPLTSESKSLVVPEPLLRFSGGAPFGTYTAGQNLIFMFQQFRFRENTEISLAFIENSSTRALEMKGREDLKACDDQVFESNFWPALMVEKKDEEKDKVRFALVPLSNPDREKDNASQNGQISVELNEDSVGKFSVANNLNIIFIETIAVVKSIDTGMKTATNDVIYSYKLNPTSRIQRILLAYHHLRLRNYDESLRLLNPRSEIDHNTRLSDDEKTILEWIVGMNDASEPEALAIRLIAKIHTIVDNEMFVGQYQSSNKDENVDLAPAGNLPKNDFDLIQLYRNIGGYNVPYMAQNKPGYFFENFRLVDSFFSVNNLKTYFNSLNHLPKRFHIEQVFRDVMPSTKIQAYLSSLYASFNSGSFHESNDFKPTTFMYESYKCEYGAYVDSHSHELKLPILQPLSEREGKILDDYIMNRFSTDYTQMICDLPRLVLQKLLQLRHNNENPDIPADLIELIRLYFYFSRHSFTYLDKYVYFLGHPDYPQQLPQVDLETLLEEFKPKFDQMGKPIASPKEKIYKLAYRTTYSEFPPIFTRKDVIFNFGFNFEAMVETVKKLVSQVKPSDLSTIFDPLKYFESETGERTDENSFRFTSEDLHYVRSEDRKLYIRIKVIIDAARAVKPKAAETEISGVLREESRTQNALQIAIDDYMFDRSEPVEYEKFIQLAIDYLNDQYKQDKDRSEPGNYENFIENSINGYLKSKYGSESVEYTGFIRFAIEYYMNGQSESVIYERFIEFSIDKYLKSRQGHEKDLKAQKILGKYKNYFELAINNYLQDRQNHQEHGKYETFIEQSIVNYWDNQPKREEYKKKQKTIEIIKLAIYDYLKFLTELGPQLLESGDEGPQLSESGNEGPQLSESGDEGPLPFYLLLESIEDRLRVLDKGMKELRKQYNGFFGSLQSDHLYNTRAVLSNLNRMFNSRGKPELEDLRDCLMKMSLKCIQGRLPEMSKKSILKIVQIVKEFYIQKIISVQFKTIKRKIDSFNDDVAKVKEETKKLDGDHTNESLKELKKEIFGSKDTAVSTIEDIYNDLEKMLLLEERVQDPVTMNFEFMSEKFHLTKVQVEDISNLATRNSEVKLSKSEMELKEREFEENYYRKRRAMTELIPSVGKLKPYDSEKDSFLSRVIQRKMAAGKTTVLGTAATVKKADGKTLSVLVILSSLYQSSAPDMQKRTSEFFKSTGFSFSMPDPRLTIPSRTDVNHPAKNFLTWTLKSLVRTINTSSYLVVTPETLQSFLNSYVEFLDAFVTQRNNQFNPELSHCLHLFATIYEIFRSRGSVILDEIDSIMRPQKELNFPTTKREKILIEGVELASDLLLHSAYDEEIIAVGLNLLANQQAALTDEQFNNVVELWKVYIGTQIKIEASPWHLLDFGSDHEIGPDSVVEFIFKAQSNDRSEFENDIEFMKRVRQNDKTKFHAMMVCKMQMKSWMKGCFNSAVNEHYGPTITQRDPNKPIYYAIPYMAANTPAEGSIFADRWETVNKTFMMYLVKKLSKEEVSRILLALRDIASSAEGTFKDEIDDNFREACAGRNFSELQFNHSNQLVDKDEAILECMQSNIEAAKKLLFIYITESIFKETDFYAEQITSNAINLTTMFPSVQGYSGTIDNVNVLPHQVMIAATDDHRLNEKANGAISWKLLQQEDCVTTIDKIEQYSEILELIKAAVSDQIKNLQEFSAFVDVGALLKDFTNKEVAVALADVFNRDIILYYNERTNQLSFYKKSDSKYMALEGSETNYLNLATNSKVSDRFTYYDQRHITGSDILQPPTARAFLTIGPKVLLRDILQGVMRMRQFQSGQSIHFVTTSAVEELLSKSCNDFPAGDEIDSGQRKVPRANTKHLLALGALNEDAKQMMENIRLYRVKIDAELRAFVLDVLTDALAQTDPYIQRIEFASRSVYYNRHLALAFGWNHQKLFEMARPLFIRNVKEDPLNWSTFDNKKLAVDAVNEYKTSRIALIHESFRSEAYPHPKWKQVLENLEILTAACSGEQKMPRSVLAYLDKTIDIPEIPPEFAKFAKSESAEQGSTVEMELQLELQQEIKVELNQVIPDNVIYEARKEPVLQIPIDNGGNILGTVSELIPPWVLGKNRYNSRPMQSALKNDILCPGFDASNSNFSEVDIEKQCMASGYVGISEGLIRIVENSYDSCSDFSTMRAREATHLLFRRGKSGSNYYYGVYLLTGNEAISLHRSWKYRSSIVTDQESFWLTDLYGYEIHGSPFSVEILSSNKFSLLEFEYEKHFAILHFRALVLNGSYNVIISNSTMYLNMRKWIGDPELQVQDERAVSLEEFVERIKAFLDRIIWISKLRNEIIPQDPLINFMLQIISKNVVQYADLGNYYKEDHAFHASISKTTNPNSWEQKLNENKEQLVWNVSKNINKFEKSTIWIIIIIAVGIISLSVVGYILKSRMGNKFEYEDDENEVFDDQIEADYMHTIDEIAVTDAE